MEKFELLFKLDKFAINVVGLFLNILRYPKYIKNKKTLKKNKELIKYKKSDKCYVCGLGPSLKQIDVEALDGDTIVVNHFYKFGNGKNFVPTFYTIADEGFLDYRHREELFEAIQTYRKTRFFLNARFKDMLSNKFPNYNNLYYFCQWKGIFKHSKKIDFTNVIGVMGNVVCEAIALAMYIGYKEIILLGCDFNSFASQKSIHCYDDSDTDRKISLSFELFCYCFAADAHYELDKYAKEHGIKIINATKGSLIDAYERKENYVSKIK